MRLSLVAARDATSKRWSEAVEKTIRAQYPSQGLRFDLGPPSPDVLVAIGDDRFLLDILLETGPETAILGVGVGFLSEVSPERTDDWLKHLMKEDYWVEERLRLEVLTEGSSVPPALNEVALTASRGGGFLRYSLEIDGERVWRDSGDGVIICTPTGSTGYGLSAGGPIVMENAEAIVVVPICSAEGQHPLVVPRKSEIMITEIESRLARDIVIDGRERVRVKASGFTVEESKSPARFVRFGKARYIRLFDKFASKHSHAEQLAGAPPSAKFVFRLLEDEGPLTEKQLIAESGLPERTVRSALSELRKRKLVQRVPSLRDTREALFAVVA